MRYRFSNCVLDIEKHSLVRDGEQVPTEPQVFDLLHLLAQNAGNLVTRDQLIREIWGGRTVSESTISARINAARRAVGDNGKQQAIIKTISRRGLKFVESISTDSTDGPVSPIAKYDHQRIRFAESADDTRIAFTHSGKGSPIVRAGHFLTHLEKDWHSPTWRPYIDAFSSDHTLIRYDQRGTGLSDPNPPSLDLDCHVDDLKAVVDSAGLDRFPLIALSQGVPVAVRFAVTNPDRVKSLVLYGGYVEGRALRDEGASADSAEAMMTMMKEGWGKPNSAFMNAFTSLFCPDASKEDLVDLVQLQLSSTSAENAYLLRNAIDHFEIKDDLEKVDVPTLVIHSRNDSVHPLSEGRKLASGIPNADMIVLESNNHILLPNELPWLEYISETLNFIGRE